MFDDSAADETNTLDTEQKLAQATFNPNVPGATDDNSRPIALPKSIKETQNYEQEVEGCDGNGAHPATSTAKVSKNI